jgi:beta-lactamase regulating signal transducer with metallopeptidase domain
MTPTFYSDTAALAVAHVSLLVLLVKATIILVAALGITMAMQRASAGARHLVWLVTLGTLLVMPALTAWGPLPLRVLPAMAKVAATPPSTAWPAQQTIVTSGAPSTSAVAAPSGLPDAAAPPVTPTRPLLDGVSSITLVLVIWAGVLLAIGCSLVWSALAVRRIVRRAHALDSAEWLTPLWEVSDRFELEEAPRLLRSDEAKMPFACGVLRPTIVLPADCEGWSFDRRRAVLLHELAHVRRHDLLGHTLGRLVCAVYWFHPLVWTAAKQLRTESERACDDLALSCGTRATDYAEHLLDIVTSVRRDATPYVALAMARRKEFEGRMLAILDPQLRHAAPSRRQTTTLIATLALIAVVVGAAAPAPRRSNTPTVEQATDTAPARLTSAPAPASTPAQASASASAPAPTPGPGPAAAPTLERDPHTQGAEQRTVSSMQAVVNTVGSRRTVISGGNGTDIVVPSVTLSVSHSMSPTASVGASATGASATVSASALRSIIQGAGRGQDQKSDDRPILLAKVLRSDTSATLRRVAAWGLSGYAATSIAAEALANAVRHDADASVREMAAWALASGDDGTAGAVDALSAALRSDADTRVRATAAWALGNTGHRAQTDALVAALADPNPEVRVHALWAIGNVQPRQAPRAVVGLLTDKNARVRELAAWALYQIEDPSAAPALDAALRAEQNGELQVAYLRALAVLGEKSVDTIRGLLESPDPRIRTMAVKALAGGHAAGPWPWPWPMPRPYP